MATPTSHSSPLATTHLFPICNSVISRMIHEWNHAMCNLWNWLFSLGPGPLGFIPEEIHFDNRNLHKEMVNIYRIRRPSPRHWAQWPVSQCCPSYLCNATQLPPSARGGPSLESETRGAHHTMAQSWLELCRAWLRGWGALEAWPRPLSCKHHYSPPQTVTMGAWHRPACPTDSAAPTAVLPGSLGTVWKGVLPMLAKCCLSPPEPITGEVCVADN